MHWNINWNYKKFKIMRVLHFLIIIAIGSSIISCSNMRPLEVKYQSIEGSGFYSTSAATKSSIVRQKGDNNIVCAEPAPDATFDMEDNSSLDMSLMNIGNKEAEGTSDSEVEAGLGGRSVNVLLTREMYFRMCEFFANTNIQDSLKIEIYKMTLQSIIGINNQNFGTGTQGNSAFTGSLSETSSFLLPDSLNSGSIPKKKNPTTDMDEDGNDDDSDF